jgi:hypothetical protein
MEPKRGVDGVGQVLVRAVRLGFLQGVTAKGKQVSKLLLAKQVFLFAAPRIVGANAKNVLGRDDGRRRSCGPPTGTVTRPRHDDGKVRGKFA